MSTKVGGGRGRGAGASTASAAPPAITTPPARSTSSTSSTTSTSTSTTPTAAVVTAAGEKKSAKKKKKKGKAGKGKAASSSSSSAGSDGDEEDESESESSVSSGGGSGGGGGGDDNRMVTVQCIHSEHVTMAPFFARLPAKARLLDATTEHTLQQQTLLELKSLGIIPDTKVPFHVSVQANIQSQAPEDVERMSMSEFAAAHGSILVCVTRDGTDTGPPLLYDTFRQHDKLKSAYAALLTKQSSSASSSTLTSPVATPSSSASSSSSSSSSTSPSPSVTSTSSPPSSSSSSLSAFTEANRIFQLLTPDELEEFSRTWRARVATR